MKRICLILLLFLPTILFAQQQEMKSSAQLKYLLYVPDLRAPENGFPVLLFLHGAGERGDDLELVKKHGPPSFLDDTTKFPFLVISPQCPANSEWKPYTLLALLNEIALIANVDTSRIYVTGLSSGGDATWELAMEAPKKIAAIAPICSEGDVSRACTLQDVPVWVFHGAQDDIVPSAYSDKMVQALQDCDVYVKYTLYPDVDHFAWVPAYSDPALYDWMLQQQRK
jgi:predicted peptidase